MYQFKLLKLLVEEVGLNLITNKDNKSIMKTIQLMSRVIKDTSLIHEEPTTTERLMNMTMSTTKKMIDTTSQDHMQVKEQLTIKRITREMNTMRNMRSLKKKKLSHSITRNMTETTLQCQRKD